MTKVVLDNIFSGPGTVETINANSRRIEAGFDNTVSLNGSVPSTMQTELDMNSFRIINGVAVGLDDLATVQDVLDLLNPAPAFGTALNSSSANGSDFGAPSEWAFGSSNFTCEFWFMDTGITDNEQFRVLRARSSGGAQNGWEVQVRFASPTTKSLRLLLRPAGVSLTFNSPAFVMADNVWAHYAFAVDRGTNTVTYYVNSAVIGTSNIAAAVGAVGFGGSMSIMQSIAGSVDELRVWSTLRSGAEIASNYTVPFTTPESQVNLIADWQFNEGSGPTTVESIHDTTATIVSGGTFVAGPVI